MAWTTGETIVFLRMARRGHTASEIARALGRDVGQIREKARHLGIKLPRDWHRRERTARRRVPNLAEIHRNTTDGFSPVAVRGMRELEWGLEWIAQHLQHGYVVHGGRVRTISQAVGNLIYEIHADARRARVGEVA